MSDDSAAPATPILNPVPQPKIKNGARIMFTITLAVPMIIPVLKLPTARSAEPMATMVNCSAMAGMNHARYCADSAAVCSSAAMARE